MKILHYPDPLLRKKLMPIEEVNAAVKKQVQQMFELMKQSNGVGLAANQVGWDRRVFVASLDGKSHHVLINPVILKRKGKIETEEGCLSFPGITFKVARPERITVEATNLSGKLFRMENVEGILARSICHEYDHLDGVLFIDRASPTIKLTLKNKIRRLEQQGIPAR